MHILWLKTELLHPVDKGGRIRTYNMLRELHREHEVTYLTLDDGSAATDAIERATEYCSRLIRVPFTTAERGSLRFFGELAANLFSHLPYSISRYVSSAMQDAVRTAAREDVDVIVCDFLTPSINVPGDLGVPTVLFQHNVESMIWKRHAEIADSRITRRYMRSQWRRMLRHEIAECRRFEHVVAVSEQDADVFRDEFGVASVSHVPTGVDTGFFQPTGAIKRKPRSLVFTGSMDWMPNEDAILWFSDDIWPAIRREFPDATLTVVGRNPSQRIRNLHGVSGIEVTGSVPDVRPFLERAELFVVPIRIGGGTRLKIYEAMAMELPVMSTRVGAEGLPLRDGTDVVLAETAMSFTRAVLELLREPERAQSIAGSGAELVRSRFGWNTVAARFADICAKAARITPSSLQS